MNLIEWKCTETIGVKERLYKIYDMQHLRLYKCVNNIVVGVLKENNSPYKFCQVRLNQKIRKGTNIMILKDQKISLPFKCKIIELIESEKYSQYCFIVYII